MLPTHIQNHFILLLKSCSSWVNVSGKSNDLLTWKICLQSRANVISFLFFVHNCMDTFTDTKSGYSLGLLTQKFCLDRSGNWHFSLATSQSPCCLLLANQIVKCNNDLFKLIFFWKPIKICNDCNNLFIMHQADNFHFYTFSQILLTKSFKKFDIFY